MNRNTAADHDGFGSDSFLDVVANIVGILIILVMVVGVRAGTATSVSRPEDAERAALRREIEQLEAAAVAVEQDILELDAQAAVVERENVNRFRDRATLAVVVSAAERALERRRQALDDAAREDFDVKQAIARAEFDLARLDDELSRARAAEASVEQIVSYPTPLSETVLGAEAQFQLRGGRITFIPMEDLLERFRIEARQKARRLINREEFTDTIGPVGGFRLRYTLERVDVAVGTPLNSTRMESYVQLVKYTLLPVSGQLGETVDEALGSRSQFRSALTLFDPKDTAITIWTYPDSFAEFRRLKAELHRLGFASAGRPLPEGESIGGSPQGSRSAAQ